MVVVTQTMVVMWVFMLCSVSGLFKHFEGIWFRRMVGRKKICELYRKVSKNFGQSHGRGKKG
jgi:hypothetical protein